MSGRQTPSWARQLLLSSFLVFLGLLQSCADISDREIVQRFEQHRADFERLARVGLSTGLSCEATGQGTKCNSETAQSMFQELHKEAGVKSVQAREDIPQLGNSVSFVMAGYGLITTNSYSKGIAYSTAPLSPVVENTDNHADMRFRFRRIADHWYVFVMP